MIPVLEWLSNKTVGEEKFMDKEGKRETVSLMRRQARERDVMRRFAVWREWLASAVTVAAAHPRSQGGSREGANTFSAAPALPSVLLEGSVLK